MLIIYNLIISAYRYSITFASFFNTKALFWVNGRKEIFKHLKNTLQPDEKRVWFHCASLGEFEQGRPVIEAYRLMHPEFKIMLTFFSPSGFEVRKNYPGADYIFYLPADTKQNARQFISLVKPHHAFFIKYEFWYHYITELKKRNIPLYLVSAIFRPDQLFFKWYGGFYKNLLYKFNHFFVQNHESVQLLNKAGIKNITLSGDTRFDRVLDIAKQNKKIPFIKEFKGNQKLFVAGSTWPEDEQLIINFIKSEQPDLKFIIAPHEITKSKMYNLDLLFKKNNLNYLKYSQFSSDNIDTCRVLVIDNIGILSSLYQYGEMAYIGGGFGKGIHNILEAATFGLPVLFGPNYKKFKEANDLIESNGAFPIQSGYDLKIRIAALLTEHNSINHPGDICRKYVLQNQGATKRILELIH